MPHRLIPGLALAAVAARPLAAQGASPSPAPATRPTSVDLTFGADKTWGGSYTAREGFSGEITIVPGHRGARIAAVTLGGRANPGSGDICDFEAGPGTRCLPKFPAMMHLGVLAGLEGAIPGAEVRLMTGPALYAGSGRPGLGGQLHADVAFGVAHFAVVGALRGGLVARSGGETLRLGSLEFGVRLR